MKNIKKYAAILAVVVAAALFLPAACTQENPAPPEESVAGITMITKASEVSFYLETDTATHSIVIDWGDGEGSKTYVPKERTSSYSFCSLNVSHSYSDASEHCITITGDSIDMLHCDGYFTVLDVSKYPKLRILWCWETPLNSLDVSKNTALESLWCSRNQLTSLDLSNCTEIESLRIDDNPLTSLDLSVCTALDYLTCMGCQLTSLDVNKNTALTVLSCNDNQLTTLDVSKNTAIYAIYCANNQLNTNALNDLFRSLPDRTETNTIGLIEISGNPGEDDCDFSIATKKGWRSTYWGPKSLETENPEELYLNYLKQYKP